VNLAGEMLAEECMTAVSPPAPLLTMHNVEKRFDNGTLALRGVNLAIERGSFVSLLGASGCGKSTILKLIAGLSTPSGGSIAWAAATADHARTPRLSFVFQEPTLMPWTRALENVVLPLKIAGVKKEEARDRARQALADVGLGNFERAYPREMSGGMKMRVSIARALVTRPDLLLLDEPFAALDEITRFKINNDLAELWRAQRFTTIFVTHSVFESVYLSQRVVILAARPGRVFADVAVRADDKRNEAFRTSTDYGEQCRHMSQTLKEAMSS
jgi:NitT/TauT family transport system ATP-binding protein